MKALRFFLRTLGSLALAVTLLAVLAVALALTTFVESAYGEGVVQYFVYQSWWFYGFLFLLAVNVLCSMLTRFPWKKTQLPFLTAHWGILVLLLGCYVTATWNQEANLTLVEGKSARYAVAKGNHFALTPVSLEPSDEQQDSVNSSIDEESPQFYADRLDRERRSTIEIPFDAGPFDWENYNRKNWFGETPRKYRRLLWTLMNLNAPRKGKLFVSSKKNRQQNLSEKIQVEVLDYLANSAKTPAGPLKMSVQWNRTENSANSAQGARENCELHIVPQVGTFRGSTLELGLGASQTFQDGERITFRIAESQAEADAFLKSEPSQINSGLGTIVLVHQGKKFEVPVDLAIQKSALLRPKMDPLRNQMSDLMRQRQAMRIAESHPTPSSENKPNADDEEIAEKSVLMGTELANAESMNMESVNRKLERQGIDAKIAQLIKDIDALRKESFYTRDGSEFLFEFSQFHPEGPQMRSDRVDDADDEPDKSQNSDQTADAVGSANLRRTSPIGPMIHITIHAPNGNTDQMLLYSSRPDINSQAKKFGFYGTYCFSPSTAKAKEANFFSPNVMQIAEKPRLDLIQTPKGTIVYRFWRESRFVAVGEVPMDKMTNIVQNDVILSPIEFAPHDLPGYNIESIPFEKNRKYVPQQRAKVRVSLDGMEEEFWILAQFSQQEPYNIPLDEEQIRWLQSKSAEKGTSKLIRFTYARNEIDLGFSLYLKKFTQKMEPGTQTASQFSSLVDMRRPEEIADRLDLLRPEENRAASFFEPSTNAGPDEKSIVPIKKNVLIKMNQPGLFRDQFTGRKYRVYQSSRQGPFGPETPEFHFLYDKSILLGETAPREGIFMSILSVNHDPGRGLKYLGSALLIFGTAWMFYGKRKRLAA